MDQFMGVAGLRKRQVLGAVIAAALLLAPLPGAAQGSGEGGGILAVLELKNRLQGEEKQQVDLGYFTDQVRQNSLRAVPGLMLMTRENMIVLIEAQGKTLAECEGECEVQTGQRLGADYVVSGEILRVGTLYKVNLRLHDTRTAALLSGVAVSGKSVEELDANTAASVEQLCAPLLSLVSGTGRAGSKDGGVPQLSDELRNGESKVMQAGASAAIAYQVAMDSEPRGQRQPVDAAEAWSKLAAIADRNPFRKAAEQRARQWSAFAEKRSGQLKERKAALDKLRRLLIDPAAQEAQKEEGFGAASKRFGVGPLLGLIPLTQPESMRQTLYSKACAAGAGQGCRRVGDQYKDTDETRATQAWVRAAALLDKGCTAGEFADCEELAGMQREGVGQPPDLSKALQNSLRACEGNDARGCGAVALAYREGKVVALDPARAKAYSSRAQAARRSSCDDGDDSACEAAAATLEGTDLGAADLAGSLALHEKACALGNMSACTTVAEACRTGRGYKKDLQRMSDLYLRACRGGSGKACRSLGQALGAVPTGTVSKLSSRVAALYAAACDRADAEGCNLLGAAFDTGTGVLQSGERAAVLEAKACEYGSFEGCRALAGKSNPPAVDEKKADAAFRLPCEQAKNMAACYQLGHLYLNGEGLPKRTPAGLVLLRRACSAEVPGACSEIP